MVGKRTALAVALIACLISSLTGCEKKSKTDAPGAPPNTTETP
jgi:hypothetical protein